MKKKIASPFGEWDDEGFSLLLPPPPKPYVQRDGCRFEAFPASGGKRRRFRRGEGVMCGEMAADSRRSSFLASGRKVHSRLGWNGTRQFSALRVEGGWRGYYCPTLLQADQGRFCLCCCSEVGKAAARR